MRRSKEAKQQNSSSLSLSAGYWDIKKETRDEILVLSDMLKTGREALFSKKSKLWITLSVPRVISQIVPKDTICSIQYAASLGGVSGPFYSVLGMDGFSAPPPATGAVKQPRSEGELI